MKRHTARTTTYWGGLLAALAVVVAVARVEAAVIVASADHYVVAGDVAPDNNPSGRVTHATDSTLIPESTTLSASTHGSSASTLLTRTPSAFSASFDHTSAVGDGYYHVVLSRCAADGGSR